MESESPHPKKETRPPLTSLEKLKFVAREGADIPEDKREVARQIVMEIMMNADIFLSGQFHFRELKISPERINFRDIKGDSAKQNFLARTSGEVFFHAYPQRQLEVSIGTKSFKDFDRNLPKMDSRDLWGERFILAPAEDSRGAYLHYSVSPPESAKFSFDGVDSRRAYRNITVYALKEYTEAFYQYMRKDPELMRVFLEKLLQEKIGVDMSNDSLRKHNLPHESGINAEWKVTFENLLSQ